MDDTDEGQKRSGWNLIRRQLPASRHSNWLGYTRVHTSILRFDEGLFIDQAIHAPRRPFSHVLGSQEVGKSSFFRSVSVLPAPSAPFASASISFALFSPGQIFLLRSLIVQFLSRSPSLCPYYWVLHLCLARARTRPNRPLCQYGENAIYPRHASQDTTAANRTCQSLDYLHRVSSLEETPKLTWTLNNYNDTCWLLVLEFP